MPNLFSFKPVEIYGWVFGSTSGFTRNDTGADFPTLFAISFNLYNSLFDSTLKHLMSLLKASFISSSRFPTPEKTIFFGSPPAFITRYNSPPETTSKPEPNFAKIFRIEMFELALTA